MIFHKVRIDFGPYRIKGGTGGAPRIYKLSQNMVNRTISIVVMKIEYFYDTDV